MGEVFDTLAALRRGDLAGARELRLPPGLGEVPREIFGLADTLEVLDLSGCGIDRLPDDLGRLRRLRALFCSGNRFDRLPPVLGDCAALSQIGFRGTGLREVPGEALPPNLRWLILTDNRIETMPRELGEKLLLQKLMLAGNRLRALPDSLAGASNLELLRLAANAFDDLPPWLAELPHLAWLAWGGNPCEPDLPISGAPSVRRGELAVGALLGEGASGRIHRALWQESGAGEPRPVALKLFKGAMTSDGLPEREMEACLAAGNHPNLVGALGRLADHPERGHGLLLRLVSATWRVLAGPPSPASCSRDVYDPGLSLAPAAALRTARGIASAAAHLHARGLSHGDLYAHNVLWDGETGDAVLSDFGAASALPTGSLGDALQRIEVRAFGLLLGELLDRSGTGPAGPLRVLEHDCTCPGASTRPLMMEVVAALGRLLDDQ